MGMRLIVATDDEKVVVLQQIFDAMDNMDLKYYGIYKIFITSLFAPLINFKKLIKN
jgi:hypothetical protein